MGVYIVNGQVFPKSNAANDAAIGLWNPHASKRIRLIEFSIYMVDFDSSVGHHAFWQRTSTRGTPGATITPSANNEREGQAAPPSGFVVDSNYTAWPTKTGSPMEATDWTASAVSTEPATGLKQVFPRGIDIPPGSGFAFCMALALITWASGGYATYVVED